jgi:hypothetical protein
MGTYRIYRLDGAGRIRGAEWLDALDDRFALEGARALADGGGCPGGYEVWQRERLVGKVAPRVKREQCAVRLTDPTSAPAMPPLSGIS